MYGSSIPWGNESHTARTITHANALLKTGITNVLLGPYTSRDDFEPLRFWLPDVSKRCAKAHKSLTVSISSPQMTECIHIAIAALAAGAGIVEIDISTIVRYSENDPFRRGRLKILELNSLLHLSRAKLPSHKVHLKIPMMSKDDIVVLADAVRTARTVSGIVATAVTASATVLPIRKSVEVPATALKLRKEQTLKIIVQLSPPLLGDGIELIAAADIETPDEAMLYMAAGASGFQIGHEICKKPYGHIAEQFVPQFNL